MENLFISNWVNSSLDLGAIPVGKNQVIIFERREDLKKISRVISSCHCAVAQVRDKEVVIKFKPQPIPMHLSFQGYYIVTKRVNVIYEDASFDELTFTAKIIKI